MEPIDKLKNQELVIKARYYQPNENWQALSKRVANAISEAENGNTNKDFWCAQFYNAISQRKFIPGGRTLRNAGRLKGNLLNCFVLPIEDNIEAIGETMKNSLIIWSHGGGVGINFSQLRPKGAGIKGKGGYSSGLVSFLEAIDAAGNTIESGGQRRAAAIAIVDISHPEIEGFIDAKLKHGKLRNFNISVAITNEFLEALERNNTWSLKFQNEAYKEVNARRLWKKILSNMLRSAEPGLVNLDNLVVSNSYYFAPIIGTNPCGELPLPAYGSCNLGSLVLPEFVAKNRITQWKELEEVIKVAVRFLDNVIDTTTYPLLDLKIVAEKGRRIGLGVMGLADYLFRKKLRYGSNEANIEIETLFRFIRNKAYYASIELAKEKHSFPKFDSVDFGKAKFVKKLPAKLRLEIKEYGIRNVELLTCAPTGTTSTVIGTTGGMEPLFSKSYRRVDKISAAPRIVIHPIYQDLLLKNKKIPKWFVDSYDLKPEEHFEVQALIQKYIDGAISKTINLPQKTTVNQLSNWLHEYMYDLKGVTIYVNKSRKQQVLYPLTQEETIEYLKKHKER